MISLRKIFFIALLIPMLMSCAAKNMVVLLPDPDGKVGAVSVSNKGGSQVISSANSFSGIDSAEKQPEAPKAIDQKKIDQLFGPALKAQPSKPIHFTLYFEFNSDNLTAESKIVFNRLLAEIRVFNPSAVAIIGHTDSVGTSKANYELGLERAVTVKKIIESAGVNPSIIEVSSHGKDNLLIKTKDNAAEPRNRRIEAVIR
jgi:outer membrane protein OmpA-like peptidoglycan-associated protein